TGPRRRPEAVDWVSVLRVLDRRRALAFAAADPRLLTEVYTAGSPPGRADQRLLASYADRRLRVVGLRMALLDVRLLQASARHARLRVVDRVAAGVVVTAGGRRTALPPDRPTTRRIALVRLPSSGWRIAGVRLPRGRR
ncbi:MAG: hypothetical protein M3P83_07275, partial [Actinomycetota bacterium]|nr:hypothetical protein [Actinomycetota bacterium]